MPYIAAGVLRVQLSGLATVNTEMLLELKLATAKQLPLGEKATEKGNSPPVSKVPTKLKLQVSGLTVNIEILLDT